MLAHREPKLLRSVAPALLPADPSVLPTVVPSRWHGQVDCRVGPFSGRPVAEHFARRVVDFGLFEAFSRRIFARRDGWFVEVRPYAAEG